MASPARNAANACTGRRRRPGGAHSRHASARATNRSPASSNSGTRPQPTRRMPSRISETPARRAAQANRRTPPSAAAINRRCWRRRGIMRRELAGTLRFQLPERLFDQPFVVFLRDVALQQLGRNRNRQFDRLVPDLLERTRRLELDLLLGVLHDIRGFLLRLLPQLVAEPVGIVAGTRNDVLRLPPRLTEDALRFALQPLELLPGLGGIVERLPDRRLALVQCLE